MTLTPNPTLTLSTMEQTNPETDTCEATLADFTSACYEQENAAERYLAAVQRRISGCVVEELAAMNAEQLDACETYELAQSIVDKLDAVIYSHHARAIVIGYGEEEARHEYAWEMGADETGHSVCQLAHFILHEYACQEAGEERVRLMCLAEIEGAEEVKP